MTIKDWKNIKPKKYPKLLTEYGNLIILDYKNRKTLQHISLILIKGLGYKVTVRHSQKEFEFSEIILESVFKSKSQALKFAKNYMRKH